MNNYTMARGEIRRFVMVRCIDFQNLVESVPKPYKLIKRGLKPETAGNLGA